MSQRTSAPGEPGGGALGRQRTRREMLTLMSVGMGGVAALIVAVPVVGALLAPLLRSQTGQWRPVGSVESFEKGQIVLVAFQDTSPLSWAGPAANTAAWLYRLGDQEFVAYAINCTHLGCPVRWLPSAGLFMCPCHGGVFYRDGTVAAGPPPKPLNKYPVRIADGQVQIQTSAVPIG